MNSAYKFSDRVKLSLFKVVNNVVVSHNDKKIKIKDDIFTKSNVCYDKCNSICTLDVYSPREINNSLPIIIYYHGGGWAVGDKKLYSTFCRKLSSYGFIVFNVNYTLTCKEPHPTPMKDCINAAQWVYNNGSEFSGDTKNIFICGDSSGAHISALIGNLCSNKELYELYEKKYNIKISFKSQLRGLGILCGVDDLRTCYKCDFPHIKLFAKMLLGSEEVLKSPLGDELAVVKNMTSDFPPSFITTTENDPIYDESVSLEKGMKENNILYKILSFDKSHKKLWHVYQINQTLPESKQCLNEMVEFFKSLIN